MSIGRQAAAQIAGSDGAADSAPRVTVQGTPGVRTRVLAAADELFYRDGIRATGINAIVTQAGTAKASLYQHFSSKDDVVVAWLETRSESWLASFDQELERRTAGGDSRTLAVFDVLQGIVTELGRRGCPFINVAVELADASHPARAVAAVNKASLRVRLEDVAEADGVERFRELAAQLYLLFEGAIVASVIQGTPAPVSDARRAAARLLQVAVLEEGSQ